MTEAGVSLHSFRRRLLLGASHGPATEEQLDRTDALVRRLHNRKPEDKIFFFEVERSDASKFDQDLVVDCRLVGRHVVLGAKSSAVANSIAALLLTLQEKTGRTMHVYFKWKERNPLWNMVRFLFLGEGDEAPRTHEILRRTVPEPERRPIVHVS